MTVKYKLFHKLLSVLVCVAILMTCLPLSVINAGAASSPLNVYDRVTDNPTVNGWQDIFTPNSTENAGGVWTDKSVFKTVAEYLAATAETEAYTPTITDANNFLVSLSAIASSKQITGYSTIPTDTVLVLDMSSSMQGSDYNSILPLANATNKAIKELISLNKNNRVAVVLYSGATGQNDNTTLPTRILMPLDRYSTTDSEGDFIEYKEIQGTISSNQLHLSNRGFAEEGIAVVSGVTNSKGETNFGLQNNQSRWSAGTFTQDGIYAATQILLASDKVITEDGNVQEGQERMPVMVLMSDGEPSVFSTDYAGTHDYDMSDGLEHLQSVYLNKTTSTGAPTEFMVQLTAAYSKYLIEQEYEEHDLLFYSLGLRGNDNFATTILDPVNNDGRTKDYWKIYLDNNDYQNLRLSSNNVPNFSITTSAQIRAPFVAKVKSTAEEDLRENGLNKYRYYIDKYFDAPTDSQLENMFDEIVAEITLQSKYYPTHIETSNINYGGYLTLVDTIGKYMEVKDMKNIQLGGEIFRGRNAARELSEITSSENLTGIKADLFDAVMNRLHVGEEDALEAIHTAHESGVLYFNNDDDFRNAIGWYGNYTSGTIDPTYIAAWDGNESATHPANANCTVKSYYFYGAGESNEGETRTADMRYIEVEVVTFLDGSAFAEGSQKVRVRIPASLIPLITYEVQLDGDSLEDEAESLTTDLEDATPIRLLYEVGLKENINSLNVGTLAKDAYNSATGKYEFYTNKWDYIAQDNIGKIPPRDVGNSYAFFEPSAENEYMYYQFDTTIYTKVGENNYVPYTGDAIPSGDGYYGQRYIYTKPAPGTTTPPTSVYYAISAEHIDEAKKVTGASGTSWILPKGTHTMADGEAVSIYKIDGNDNNGDGGLTKTYKTSSTYYVEHDMDGTTPVYNMEVALGNNGLLTMEALQGIRLQKIVPADSGLDATASYEFTIKPVTGSLTGSFDLYVVDAIDNDGAAGATDNGSVTADSDGSIKVNVKSNQTLYIAGLPTGDYTVTEAKGTAYVVSAINGVATSENSTTVTVNDREFTTTSFTNIERTTGNIAIAKEIVHPFGPDYEIPDEVNSFEMLVTLTLNEQPLAGTFSAKQSNKPELTSVTANASGQFTVTLAHDAQIEIFDLPENTVVKVVETTVREGFSAEYWNDGDVTANAFGEVTISTTDEKDILVANHYTPSSVSPNLIVNGTKNLLGDAHNGSFIFKLQRAENNNGTWSWVDIGTEQVVTYSGANGKQNFSFGDVLKNEVYTEVGNYYYRVTEITGTNPKIIYDTNIHSFTVHVTDKNMDGQLEILTDTGVTTTRPTVVSITGTTVNTSFTNTHTNDATVTVTLDVEKTVNNPTDSSAGNILSGFEFDLAQGEMGETLVTNERGALRFTMNYTAADLGGEKTKTFTYTLKEVLPTGYVNGSGAWTYDDKEVTVTVVLTLNDDDSLSAVITDNDTNASNTDSAITVGFENTYNPAPTTLKLDFVRKALSGRYLTDAESDKFDFNLVAAPIANPSEIRVLIGNTPTVVSAITGENNKDGVVTFTDALYFDEVGTYFYEIVEVAGTVKGIGYDNTTHRIIVEVDDINGTLVASYHVSTVSGNIITFYNTYTPDPITYTVDGDKILTGRDLRDGEFTFVMTASDKDGNAIANAKPLTAVNNVTGKNTGTFAFAPLSFNKEGTYYYTVSEQKGIDNHGITYSVDKFVVEVVVTYSEDDGKFSLATSIVKINEDGKSTVGDISFENTYKAEETYIDFNGTKSLIGNRELNADDFTFDLYEIDEIGAPKLVKSVTNEADGNFAFKDIALKEAKIYRFEIKERIPDTTIKGVTYDEAFYRIKVEVTDNGNGHLVYQTPEITRVAEDELTALTIAFYNIYDAKDAPLTIGGDKELTGGRPLAADEFTFKLYTADENFEINQSAPVKTANNKADKTFAFEELIFSEEGTYYYIVEEDDSNKIDRIKYDDTRYYITVTVTDDTENGELKAVSVIKTSPDATTTVDKIVFNNKYIPKPTDIILDIDVDKKVENKGSVSITAEGFEFALLKDGDTTPSKVKTDKNGKAKFKLSFTENDIGKTYNYTLTEINDGRSNVKYSTAKYEIAITVSLNDNNELVATVTQDSLPVDNVVAEFVNEYDYTPPTSPPTGDSSNFTLWLALLVVSGCGLIGTSIYGRKKEQET